MIVLYKFLLFIPARANSSFDMFHKEASVVAENSGLYYNKTEFRFNNSNFAIFNFPFIIFMG